MDDAPLHHAGSVDLSEQIAALLESTALLQRTASHILSQLHPGAIPPISDPNRSYISQIDLTHHRDIPQSAQASVLAAGVPLQPRGWQRDHSPKDKIIARTKERLMKDGWEDCEDTDIHATRLSEAMLRLGMEDMDNFATEASRLNCSNMAISATLVSAVVATFVANTYDSHESLHMRVVNGLWLLSLFMSLAVAALCMLVSEWLTWSTSQELRDLSVIYRLIRTAFRSLLMHLSIFLFFAGLMVLMWNESTVAVCIVPTIACGMFVAYYVTATVRGPFMSFFQNIRQFDDHDFRGLRVQIWTPFTLGTHHTLNYLWIFVVKPIQKVIGAFGPSKEDLEARMSDQPGPNRKPTRPILHNTQTGNSTQTKNELEMIVQGPSIPYQNPEQHDPETPLPVHSPGRLHVRAEDLPGPRSRSRGRSPLTVRDFVDSPRTGAGTPRTTGAGTPRASRSRAGTPTPAEIGIVEPFEDLEEIEFRRKLKATRRRRLTEHEVMRSAPVRGDVEV